jgi:hypothetical protein
MIIGQKSSFVHLEAAIILSVVDEVLKRSLLGCPDLKKIRRIR